MDQDGEHDEHRRQEYRGQTRVDTGKNGDAGRNVSHRGRVRPKNLTRRQPRRNHLDREGKEEVMSQAKINETNAKDETADLG